jgi:hypothetical protein
MGTHFGLDTDPPRSPFALNVVTVIIYVIAALVVFCWFVVLVDEVRPLAARADRPRGEVLRPAPAAGARDAAQEEKMPSQVRPTAQAG